MDEIDKLSMRQAILWFATYQIGSLFLVLPRHLVLAAKQDAWISAIVAVLLQFLVFPIYIVIIRQLKGKSIYEYIEMVLGKYGGKIALVIFTVMFPYFIFIVMLRNLTDFIMTSIMTETPPEPIALMMLIAVISVVRSGVAVIGRCIEIVMLFMIFIYIINVCSFMLDTHFENILPMFEHGVIPIIKGSVGFFSNPYLESVILLFLIGNMTDSNKWKKTVMTSVLISGFIYTTVTFFAITLLSPGVVSNLTFPTYFIVRTISIGDFFERFEIIVSMFFYLTIFFKLSLLLYVTAKILTHVFGLQEYRSLPIPLALIAMALQKGLWPNIVVSQEVLRTTPIIHGTLFGLIFPCILCVIAAIKGKKQQT